jgi:3-phenylpropionate/cinnamic acid dioxygenase small subunit
MSSTQVWSSVGVYVQPGSEYSMEYFEDKYQLKKNSTLKNIKTSKASSKKPCNSKMSIAEQIEIANEKYNNAVSRYNWNALNRTTTPKMAEDVWAWELFSQTVLPGLTFLDE